MSSNSKGLYFIGSLLVLFFLFSHIGNFNLSKVATDSGFDTSYGGSSSSSSSSSSSWDSDSSGGGDGDLFGWFENIAAGIFFIIVPTIGLFQEKKLKDKLKWLLACIIIIALVVFRILVLLIAIGMGILMFSALPSLIKDSFKKSKTKKRSVNYLPKSSANMEVLKEGYDIFVNVQNAWMDFNYDKLRESTTDNLYNMYYNQLQTLALKGQKNKMHDFELVNYELIRIKEKEDLITTTMELEVKFYDYIVDQNDKVIRGNKKRKVHMTYELVFVQNKKAIKECPNCNAPLSEGVSVCSYCNTTITSISGKMKLSTKKCIRQR